jgi:acyl carrier protein
MPAVSINWCPWADVGVAAQLGTIERFRKQGIDAVSAQDGLEILEAVIDGEAADVAPQIAVLPIDWPAYLRQLPGRAGRLSAFCTANGNDGPQERQQENASLHLLEIIKGAPVARRAELLLADVHVHAAGILGLPHSAQIERDRPLAEMGLDSLLAVELRSALATAYGRTFPATLLFDYPTLERLTAYLGREVLAIEPWTTVGSAVDVDANADTLAGIEQLTDDEVERLLAERLAGRAI